MKLSKMNSLDAKQLALLLDLETEILSGLGDENLITGQVASGGVVSTVRDSPRVVRDQESRVDEPSDSVVNVLGRREGLVASLVTVESVGRVKTRAEIRTR
jgi:hypothetical protein